MEPMTPVSERKFSELVAELGLPRLVSDLMSANVQSCQRGDPLHLALRIMWEEDCGAVPVVDGQGRPIAMVTDRDVAMAFHKRNGLTPGSMVSTAMSRSIHTCRPEQTMAEAIQIMKNEQVRRLAVVSDAGSLVGMLSLADLVRRTALVEAAETLAAIIRPRGERPAAVDVRP